MSRRVVVIGAGPAGLIAALDAARAGHDVEVIEAAPFVGGMSASFEVAGQRVDFGSHRLHPSTAREFLDELADLLGDDLQVRERNGRIRLRDSWISFPLRASDLVRRLPPSFAARATFDSLTGFLRRPTDESFAGQVRAGLGPTVFSEFYGPYARKLWGVAPEEIDAAMAARRVSAGSALDIAKRLARARQSAARQFLYPRLGYGQISDRLAEAVARTGGSIRVDTPLESIDIDAEGVSVRTDHGETIDADVVLSSVPIATLARRTVPGPDADVLASADTLEYRGMVFVYLVCDQPQYTSFDAHYFPGLDTPIARLSEPKNYRDGPDPTGQTVLCAELACTEGDATWQASDEELGAIVAESLVEQGLPRPNVSACESRRLPRVYPVYRPGFQESLDALEAWASSFDRLLTFGRQGLFVPDNLHHTLQMGRAAAAAITDDGTIDRRSWNEARASFRAHVVED